MIVFYAVVLLSATLSVPHKLLTQKQKNAEKNNIGWGNRYASFAVLFSLEGQRWRSSDVKGLQTVTYTSRKCLLITRSAPGAVQCAGACTGVQRAQDGRPHDRRHTAWQQLWSLYKKRSKRGRCDRRSRKRAVRVRTSQVSGDCRWIGWRCCDG